MWVHGWSSHTRAGKAERERRRDSVRQWAVPSFCALISIVIHAVLLEVVVFGDAGRVSPAVRERGIAASNNHSDEEPLGTLIFVEEQGTAPSRFETLQNLASRGVALSDPYLTVVVPDVSQALELVEQEGEDLPSTDVRTGIDTGRAELFGRYMNQIRARIERAWIRPRVSPQNNSFACRAQILQNKQGVVLEVTLLGCDAEVSWQLSLVQAIEQASPLPAPPDPAVFADLLRLSFQAEPYRSDGSDEGFEPRSVPSAAAHYQVDTDIEND
jgi:hypothetical protein